MSPPEPATPAGAAAGLILQHRWGALGTLGSDGPSVSHVAYAPERDLGGLLMFLSGLSAHTRHLAAEPRASLGISESDPGDIDPQTLVRVGIKGSVVAVPRDRPGFDPAWSVYRSRFPAAARLLALADFGLYRLEIESVRYVGGFGRAATLRIEQLREALPG